MQGGDELLDELLAYPDAGTAVQHMAKCTERECLSVWFAMWRRLHNKRMALGTIIVNVCLGLAMGTVIMTLAACSAVGLLRLSGLWGMIG